MADKTMHHVVIGSDTYEIVDETARENVSVALSAYPTDTATGTIATFPDGADNVPVKSLTVQIQPQQAGSGDPSPDNVRAISGWDTVHVYVDETVGTHDKTYTVNLPQTVYGGTLDVSTGVLTVDKVAVDLGTLTWQTRYTGSINKALSTNLDEYYPVALDTSDSIAENYTVSYVAGAASLSNPDNLSTKLYRYYNTSTESSKTLYVVVGVDDAPTGLFVYPLANHQTIQLTPTEVSTLLGDNNIYADAGSVSVVYRADTGLYIDKRLSNA